MNRISLFLFFILLSPHIFSFPEKYLFKNKKSCDRCLAEIEENLKGEKTEYRCRPGNSSQPERDHFIEMRYFSKESMEFLKIIERESSREKSSKKKRSLIREQRGLTADDIRKLCPKTYTALQRKN